MQTLSSQCSGAIVRMLVSDCLAIHGILDEIDNDFPVERLQNDFGEVAVAAATAAPANFQSTKYKMFQERENEQKGRLEQGEKCRAERS